MIGEEERGKTAVLATSFAVKALVRLRNKWEEPSILETPLIPSHLFSSGSSHHL